MAVKVGASKRSWVRFWVKLGDPSIVFDFPAQQRREFEENQSYFLEEEREIADDSKRFGSSKNGDEVFGSEGTFKRLNID